MKQKPLLVISVALCGAFLAAAPASAEDCFGVVLSGENECATSTNSCAGHSLEDGQSDAYVSVPNGVCLKLVGGSLTPK